MPRKICVVTATRAEYGALRGLLTEIVNDPDLVLQLIATGTHLSPEFGYTLKEIEADGFIVTKKIEMLLSSDSAVGVSKSIGLAQISFAEAYDDLKPDIIVVIGDRYELIPIVTCANIAHIPVAHISGGEITEGALDDIFRHAITKLSQLHFTGIEAYTQRVIQMGEEPNRVFTVGEPGLENIKNMKLLSKPELEAFFGKTLQEKNLLITYHPDTCDSPDITEKSFNTLLNTLDSLSNTLLIFTKANADVGGRNINMLIDSFVSRNPDKAIAFESLGKLRYLSTLQFVDGVIGNSSSGIVEVSSFQTGTINIGNRQKGRIRPSSVLDVPADQSSINNAIAILYSNEFQQKLKLVKNPYVQENTSQKIKDHLKSCNIDLLMNKKFYDLQN